MEDTADVKENYEALIGFFEMLFDPKYHAIEDKATFYVILSLFKRFMQSWMRQVTYHPSDSLNLVNFSYPLKLTKLVADNLPNATKIPYTSWIKNKIVYSDLQKTLLFQYAFLRQDKNKTHESVKETDAEQDFAWTAMLRKSDKLEQTLKEQAIAQRERLETLPTHAYTLQHKLIIPDKLPMTSTQE